VDAIGFIETRGLIPAIEAADVMLKSAQIELVERSIVGGGIVTVTVTGDVGAVKSAVDAGASATQNFGSEALMSHHVIPRPSEQVSEVIYAEKKTLTDFTDSEEVEKNSQLKSELEKDKTVLPQKPEFKPREVEVSTVEKENVIKEEYKELNVKELRKLAKKYNNLGMKDEELQTATRAVLREHFENYSKE
jgi:ethanolamine utilization protein EutM